jgi:hypothetical protein
MDRNPPWMPTNTVLERVEIYVQKDKRLVVDQRDPERLMLQQEQQEQQEPMKHSGKT